MMIIRPAGFNTPPLLTALSTRIGGPADSPFGMNLSFNVADDPVNVHANRAAFFGELGVSEEELAIPRQVHSARVLCVDRPGSYADCDGLITAARRVFLCVSFADCLPVFIHESHRNIVACIHSGWRGTASGIAAVGVRLMAEQFGAEPSMMRAYIGPGAGVCCYAVGDDVSSRFDAKFRRQADGKTYVDLKSAVVSQLLGAGLHAAAIEINPSCTISEPLLFHSHRRDSVKSGRMMGVIGLS